MKKRLLLGVAIVLTLAAIVTFGITHYLNDAKRTTPLVYSDNAMLLELWTNYKKNTIEASSNRTLDKSQNNLTTSEGESYTMLRAVWMDDRTTFDNSWNFTKNNMQRPDKLISWKFGQRADGSYGILTAVGGQNTAADADVDTALALMMAYSRWNQSSYLYQAKEIVNGIWDQEVVQVAGRPVLAADDLEKNSADSIVVNPSYFSPYSFKLFARVDPNHDWTGLSDNSYSLLASLSQNLLGSTSSSGLPPNWIKLDIVTGAFIPNVSTNLDTNYGYDALRIPFRLALDYQWYKDPRDKTVLKGFTELSDSYRENGKLAAVYAHDGSIVANYETPAMYGGAIGYFNVIDPTTARQLYTTKLQTLYSPDSQTSSIDLSYYDDNWAWFGMALTQQALPNLAEMGN